MKKNTLYLLVIAIVVISIGVWYFMRPVQYCEVVYSENPNTRKLQVTCDATNCNKTCYLHFRKRNSSDDWRTPNDSHSFDTTVYEYRCKCK